ncbi:hypothetical protein O181_040375 [Austropuccinia psidii MF-1]|uniref:Reverse transcriptase Ty1/copia-type domain-containing protein n=1 Tax=Austropuccinia psidii MF-1 TaxID=1389203 RepID=A0A9Q3DGM3_9BASI|nr:hypothetical protein [Austropuccinia psidii MF-1]
MTVHARIWIRFCRITYNGSLQSFISEFRQCLKKVISVKVEVGTPTLAFTILTKLQEEYHKIVEKATANTETLGNPNAILNLLHDVVLKEEALNLQNTNESLALNRDIFCSKTKHYCRDGKHNPLESHPANQCWQLHPNLQPERQHREPKINLKISGALMTTTTQANNSAFTIVLDTCAFNHMFNNICSFTDLRHGINISNRGKSYKVFLNNSNRPALICAKNSRILETYVTLPRLIGLYTANEAWHDRLRHMHEEGIKRLIPPFKQRVTCEICSRKNHQNLDADTSDLTSESATEGDILHDALEELSSWRIRAIGLRHPTLISSEIKTDSILPFSRRAHKTNLTKNTLAPSNFKMAIESKDKEEWMQTINKELQNRKKLGFWSIEDKKTNKHLNTTTWVFKVKRDHNDKVIKHKAQLCKQGFHQIEGLDYLNNFSPTRRISSLRVLTSHAESQGFQFHQMDVKSAFLNSPPDEDLTLKIPDGIIEDPKTNVLQLHKEIYGLKQAPLAWYNYLLKCLKKEGFAVAVSDPYNGFSLSQEHYINTLAWEYELEIYSPVNTPLKPNLQLNTSTKEEETAFADLNINYQSTTGALTYISTNTRPNITFAEGIVAYADADWGNSVVNRRSTSVYTVTVNGHLASWRTKKQPTVSHSTTEAEHKALSDMTKEVEWLMRLLKEIYSNEGNSTPQLFNDNKGAIDLALSNTNHKGFKTKHMDIKYHSIRDLIKNSVIKLKYVSTKFMAADFLTQSVGKTILLQSQSFLNLK